MKSSLYSSMASSCPGRYQSRSRLWAGQTLRFPWNSFTSSQKVLLVGQSLCVLNRAVSRSVISQLSPMLLLISESMGIKPTSARCSDRFLAKARSPVNRGCGFVRSPPGTPARPALCGAGYGLESRPTPIEGDQIITEPYGAYTLPPKAACSWRFTLPVNRVVMKLCCRFRV